MVAGKPGVFDTATCFGAKSIDESKLITCSETEHALLSLVGEWVKGELCKVLTIACHAEAADDTPEVGSR